MLPPLASSAPKHFTGSLSLFMTVARSEWLLLPWLPPPPLLLSGCLLAASVHTHLATTGVGMLPLLHLSSAHSSSAKLDSFELPFRAHILPSLFLSPFLYLQPDHQPVFQTCSQSHPRLLNIGALTQSDSDFSSILYPQLLGCGPLQTLA